MLFSLQVKVVLRPRASNHAGRCHVTRVLQESISYRPAAKVSLIAMLRCFTDVYWNVLDYMPIPVAARCLRRGFAVLELRVLIPPGALVSVSCECCVL